MSKRRAYHLIGSLLSLCALCLAGEPEAPQAALPAPNPAWVFRLGPKGSLSVGTQTKQQIGGLVEFKVEPDTGADPGEPGHQRFRFDLNLDNTLTTKPGSSVRSHEYDGALNYVRYVAPHVFLVGIAEGYHNSNLMLYLQQSYGGGAGFSYTFAHQRQKIEAASDLRMIADHFYGAVPAATFAGVRIGEEYTVRLTEAAVNAPTLSINARYIPAIHQEKAWQARGRVILTVPVGAHFSFVAGITDDYMENTPRKNYSSSNLGITVDIRK